VDAPLTISHSYYRVEVLGAGFTAPLGTPFSWGFSISGFGERNLERTVGESWIESLPIGLEAHLYGFSDQRLLASDSVRLGVTEPWPTNPFLQCEPAGCQEQRPFWLHWLRQKPPSSGMEQSSPVQPT